jgi:hypothetical protein
MARAVAFIVGFMVFFGFLASFIKAMAKDLGWTDTLIFWSVALGVSTLFVSSIFLMLYGLGVLL